MIAAGSLFTSCVTNTEPQGIKDIREAKADYLASLSKLRKADAAVRNADAEYRKAETALKQAEAAIAEAAAKAAEIAVELEDAAVQAKIADIKAQAEIDAVEAQKDLAEKQEELRIALRNIELAAMTLTKEEKDAISDAAEEYIEKLDAYNEVYNELIKAERKLWSAQYDEAAAPTDTGYMLAIAAYEAKIVSAEQKIATAEGLLEEPQEVKDSIDAWKARVEELKVDEVNAENAKKLYEATVLKDANRAYDAARAAYVKDSVPAGVAFKFEKDYPLTTGKGLDEKFKVYVNGTGAYTRGIQVADDAKKIVVKSTNEKVLDTAIACVGEVVDALNRELVVVNNKAVDETVAGLEKVAAAANSVYTNHRGILEKGLKEYAPYRDSVAKIDVLKAAKREAFVNDSIAGEKVKADEVAVKDAVKDVAADYIAANKAFVSAVNDIVTGGGIGKISNTDSAAFIKAVQDLGKAQAAYLGYTDSLVIVVEKDGKLVKDNKVSIAELVASGFVEKPHANHSTNNLVTSLYGGIGYGMFAGKDLYSCEEKAWYSDVIGTDYVVKNNAFSRITAVILNREAAGYAFLASISEDNVALPLKNIKTGEAADYSYNTASEIAYRYNQALLQDDTVLFAEKYTVAAVAEIAALTADKAAKDTTAKALADATDALDNYKGVEKATIAYHQLYASFFGYDTNKETWGNLPKDSVEAPQTLPYTVKTFTTPTNCVKFVFSEETSKTTIIHNAVLYTVLMQVDETSNGDANKSKIFVGPDKHTEFTAKLYAEQLAEYAKDYKNNEQQLKNINEQFTALKADVVAKEAEVKKANEAHDAAMLKLIGEDGKAVLGLADSCVTNGKWNLKGLQKEWAEQFAPEYPEICAEVEFAETNIVDMIAEANNFIEVLDACYTDFSNIVNSENDKDLSAIFTRLNNEIIKQNNKIARYNERIAELKKALAKYNAGFDPKQINLEKLQQEVEKLTQELAQAEDELKIAEKEYNDIIKKYGVNE